MSVSAFSFKEVNYAGSKTFSINKIEDEFVKKSLIDKILLTSV